jgi:PAS domain S-box-containing protein
LIDRATVRRAWNRLNARNSRERKRFMMDSLSGRIDTLAAENRAMVELASAAGLGRELHAFLQSDAPAPAPAAAVAARGAGRSGGGSARGARAAASLAGAGAVSGQQPHGSGRQQGQPSSAVSSAAASSNGSGGGQGGVISAELSGADFALVEVVTTCQRHFLITDPTAEDNPIVFASAGFYQLTGYSPQEILGRNCRFLQGRDTDPEAVAYMRHFISRGQDVAVVLLNYRRDGSPFYNELFVAPLKGADGTVIHFVGVQSDIPAHFAAAKLPAQGRRIAEWRAKHPERGPLPPAIAAARAGNTSGAGVTAAVAHGGTAAAAADGAFAPQQQQLGVAPGAAAVTATA